eukprot:4214138-Prymnesium_polylepis.2
MCRIAATSSATGMVKICSCASEKTRHQPAPWKSPPIPGGAWSPPSATTRPSAPRTPERRLTPRPGAHHRRARRVDDDPPPLRSCRRLAPVQQHGVDGVGAVGNVAVVRRPERTREVRVHRENLAQVVKKPEQAEQICESELACNQRRQLRRGPQGLVGRDPDDAEDGTEVGADPFAPHRRLALHVLGEGEVEARGPDQRAELLDDPDRPRADATGSGRGAARHCQLRVVREDCSVPEPIMAAVVVVRKRCTPRQPSLHSRRLLGAVRALTRVDAPEELADHQVADPLRDAAGPRPAHCHHQVQEGNEAPPEGVLQIDWEDRAHPRELGPPIKELVEPLLKVEAQLEQIEAAYLAAAAQHARVVDRLEDGGFGLLEEVVVPHGGALGRGLMGANAHAGRTVHGVVQCPGRRIAGRRLEAERHRGPPQVVNDSWLRRAPFAHTAGLRAAERQRRDAEAAL